MIVKRIVFKIIPEVIKQFIFKSLIKANSKNISFGKNVKINKITKMEGCNSINNNSNLSNSYLGLGSYVSSNCCMTNTKIGRFSAIGDNVRTGLGRHPTSDFTSIHPCFYSPQKQAGFSFVQNQLYEEHVYVDISNKYFVEIGSDVWIGNNVLIMDGINIADGAIIAAGSVVVKNVNPYTIVGGVPAKLIRFRK